MRVKFIRSKSKATNRHFTSGVTYIVYEMSIDKRTGKLKFRLQRNDGVPIISDSEGFEITDSTIPISWSMEKIDQDNFSFSPLAWQIVKNEKSFWEAFFDGDEWAITLYEQELIKL